jgi:large subunit ribosomal protein L14
MKALQASVTKTIKLKTRLNCADNTGAKQLEVIAVRRYKSGIRKLPSAGVGDVVVCTVKKGNEKMMHQIVNVVIVRQSKEYRRHDGMRVKFEDNAGVVVNPKTFEPQGTEIRTVIAKEVVIRYPTIGKKASMVF